MVWTSSCKTSQWYFVAFCKKKPRIDSKMGEKLVVGEDERCKPLKLKKKKKTAMLMCIICVVQFPKANDIQYVCWTIGRLTEASDEIKRNWFAKKVLTPIPIQALLNYVRDENKNKSNCTMNRTHSLHWSAELCSTSISIHRCTAGPRVRCLNGHRWRASWTGYVVFTGPT